MRVHLLPLVVFLASAHAAAAGARVESVELTTQADGRDELRVATDRPANFTSFKLAQPTRVVVDFPETTGVAAKGTSDAGLVRRWATEQLGDDTSPVLRLTVELRDDADYALTSEGARVVLRLVPARGRPLVALDEKEREDAKEETPARLEAERIAREQAAAEERRLASEKAEQLRAEAERIGREKLERVRAAERAEAERLDAEKKAAAEKAAFLRAEAERIGREKAERVRAEADREKAERAAAAEKAAFLRAEAERIGREKAERVRAEAERAKQAERAVVASLPVARITPTRAQGGSAALQQVSFRGSAGVARLVLRTSREVTYTVEESEGRLVLALDQTAIPLAANRLPLDTRFFGTAVTRVVPREDRAGRRALVTLELAGPARHEVSRTQEGLVLVVEGPPAPQPAIAAGESDGW